MSLKQLKNRWKSLNIASAQYATLKSVWVKINQFLKFRPILEVEEILWSFFVFESRELFEESFQPDSDLFKETNRMGRAQPFTIKTLNETLSQHRVRTGPYLAVSTRKASVHSAPLYQPCSAPSRMKGCFVTNSLCCLNVAFFTSQHLQNCPVKVSMSAFIPQTHRGRRTGASGAGSLSLCAHNALL